MKLAYWFVVSRQEDRGFVARHNRPTVSHVHAEEAIPDDERQHAGGSSDVAEAIVAIEIVEINRVTALGEKLVPFQALL